MTIKARTAAVEMMEALEAETDALRASIKEELLFSSGVIGALTEAADAELKALEAEYDGRRSAMRRRYQELIRNEERRIALCRDRLEKLDGPAAMAGEADSMIGHNSEAAVDGQP